MSFILEALKKSEKSRKNNGVPTIQTNHQPPAPQPARRPIWPLLLGAVLLLNALMLLWLFAPWKKDVPQPSGMASILPGSGNVRTPAAFASCEPFGVGALAAAGHPCDGAGTFPNPCRKIRTGHFDKRGKGQLPGRKYFRPDRHSHIFTFP